MPWLWQPNSPVGQPNGLGPPMLNYAAPPSDTSQGAGVAAAGQRVWQWLQDQRAESVRQGLLDPDTGLPTQKGLVEGAKATAEGVMMGTAAPGEAPASGGLRISTRVPTAGGAAAIHGNNDLQINTDAITGTTAEAKVAAKLQGYPDVLPAQPGQDNAASIEAATQHFADNMRWIYDRTDPEVRRQSAGWYDGAHKLTRDMADQYGVPHEAVAAMTARLSPGTDWYQNVSMTKRILDIAANHDATLAPEQVPFVQSYVDAQKRPAIQGAMQAEVDGMSGKRYADMTDAQRSMFIRSLDEAKTAEDPTNAQYPMIHPSGVEIGTAQNPSGTAPANLGWQSLDNIEKALKILRNPEAANISEQLGGAHKIRSFYNNIIEPNAPHGDVTVDTHQIAASHLLPIGISDPVVEHGMSGPPYANQTGATGLYGVYADATRRVADQLNAENPGLNILPRQVQSITWEGARGLFPSALKRNKSQVQAIRDLWSNSTDAAATRDAIGASRGVTSTGDEPTTIPAPDWFGRHP
jgi:hypothetical protein